MTVTTVYVTYNAQTHIATLDILMWCTASPHSNDKARTFVTNLYTQTFNSSCTFIRSSTSLHQFTIL